MKLIRFIKYASVRTKFIGFTLGLYLLLNCAVFFLYPRYVLTSEKKNYKKELLGLVEAALMQADFENPEHVKEQLVAKIGPVFNLKYVAGNYASGSFVNRGTLYFLEEIKKLPAGTISEIEQEKVLPLYFDLQPLNYPERMELWIGTDASPILEKEAEARYVALFVLIFSGLFIYVSIMFFDRVILVPLKRSMNNLRLLSLGQENFTYETNNTFEFRLLNEYLEKAAGKMAAFREQVHALPNMLTRYKKEAKQYQESLERELEIVSNIGMYLSDLRNEKSGDMILANLNKEIIARFGFPVSLMFKFESGRFIFSGGHLKGMTILNRKLNYKLKSYVINYHNYLFKNMVESNPLVVENLPFDDILQDLNLSGQYAAVPVSTSNKIFGFLMVGKPGVNVEITHSELEKMVLLTNTVALHLENLEVVSNLERNVSQRTAELRMTNAFLEEANEEKDTMLKVISHDLNAPLRNVIGLIDSIQRKYDKMESDLNERLQRIRKNVVNELEMIDKILTSLRSSEKSAANEKIDMTRLIDTIVEELSFELRNKNITVDIEENLPDIMAIEAFVKHIFLNLIDNASKYLPEGRKSNKIEISHRVEENFITFLIADNGKGIPSESQQTIFDYYTRGKSEQASETSGKGLGLALVKNMMGKLGGEIYFDTKINKGTVFYLRFRKAESA